ncbi:SRPBCC family protein [Micromonospora sp. WMMA1363]|uniref:SRPBCC family protein n=1 Tax=Micromonospora sp. WMMA1363 TaxID=3053985 RepID=UPI00259C79C2|nr:SRPBCC family protein [Micromonospora sp. WMMA1363]MDM4719347.1 SRPBCC family protein [Micromonospora sp. WMMA1363]
MHVDQDAVVVVEASIVVAASLEAVWRLHTDVDRWPTWQHDIDQARLEGPVSPGSTFAWQTQGLSIVSTISDVRPLRRIAWGGPAHGIDGIHVWTFETRRDGVHVHTAESWDGPPVTADPDGMRSALASSLTAWLAALKTAVESSH